MTHDGSHTPANAGNGFPANTGVNRLAITVTEAGELVGQTLGDYQLRSLIGTGGMAEVYQALDLTLMREVAVKVLPALLAADAGYVMRFRAEARRVGALNHPHIVPIYAYGEEQGLLYLVMPIVRESLRDRLTQQKRDMIPPEKAVQLVLQVASALEAAHELGIVHRDVKPENILLTAEGNALLTDFGIARDLASLRREGTARTLAATGLPVGTPEYMAPEQLRGDTVDQRADIYALGVVLYELLVGEPPFRADTPYGVAALALTAPITPPSQANSAVWPALEDVVLTALARDPDTRYPNMGRFSQALHLALTRRSDMSPPLVTPAPASFISSQDGSDLHAIPGSRDTPAGSTDTLIYNQVTVPWLAARGGTDQRSPLASRRNRLLLGLLVVVMLAAGSGSVALMLQNTGTGARANGGTRVNDGSAGGVSTIPVVVASPTGMTTPMTTPAHATPSPQVPVPTPTVSIVPTATASPTPNPALTISPQPLILSPNPENPTVCTATQTITNNTQQAVGWSWQPQQKSGFQFSVNGGPKQAWPSDKSPGIEPGDHDTLVASFAGCKPQDFAVLVIDSLGNSYTFEVKIL